MFILVIFIGFLRLIYGLIYLKISNYFSKVWLLISMIYFICSISNISSIIMFIIFITSILFDIYLLMASSKDTKGKYLIVLGHALKNNEMSPILKNRLDKTIEYLKDKDMTIILCGGITDGNTISEAEFMKDYLINKGIKNKILLEDKSKTTYENISNVISIYPEILNEDVVVLSSEYHIYRAKHLLNKAGIKKVEGIGAKTPLIYLPNQLFKEKYLLVRGGR